MYPYVFVFLTTILAIRIQYLLANGVPFTEKCQLKRENSDRNADVMTCDQIKSEELLQALKMYRDENRKNILRLEIKDTDNMPCFLEREDFDKIYLSGIELRNVFMPFWKCPQSKAFQAKPNPRFINLFVKNVTGVQNWNWEEVAKFAGDQVAKLTILNNRIRRLPSTLSKMYGAKIEKLDITYDHVRFIDDGALNCPTCLEILLNDNDIKNLRREMFGVGPMKLKTLDLKNNHLRELPDNLFENFQFNNGNFNLNLKYNRELTSLKKELFQPLIYSGIKEIRIEMRGTGLVCDCKYKWLQNGYFDLADMYCLKRVGDNRDMKIQKYLKDSCR